MFGVKFIEVTKAFSIRRDQVMAYERTVLKVNPKDEQEKGREGTTIYFINGKSVVIEVAYEEVKRLLQ